MRWWSKEGPARHTARPFPATETVIQQNSLLSFCILYVVWPFEIDMYGKRKKWGFLLMSVPINPPQKVYVIVFGPSLQDGTVLNQKIRVNQKM